MKRCFGSADGRRDLGIFRGAVLVGRARLPGGGKGSVVAEPDLLRRAFRAGECRLTLDDGVVLRVAVIAHTEGGDTAYFELR